MIFSAIKTSSLAQAQRFRHRFYRQLFVLMVIQMAIMALPWGLHRFSIIATMLMLLLLLTRLGQTDFAGLQIGSSHTWLYRLLGLAGFVVLLAWLFAPVEVRWSGLLLLLLLSTFVFWSLFRLLLLLRQEDSITTSVLAGAVSGYLMLGIAGGLVLSVLESMQPGSFVDMLSSHRSQLLTGSMSQSVTQQAWDLDFSRLNYFSFVSVTTVGYGDIVPVRRMAQMACIGLSIAGPLYIAIVMGLLISRYTVQTQQEEDVDDSR